VTDMKYIFTGTSIDVTNALKERAEKKLDKLKKFFKEDTEAHVTFGVEKNRQIFEVTIFFKGGVIRAEEISDDMYTSIDKSVDTLERQIRKNKTRLGKKLHQDALIPDNFEIDEDIDEDEEFHIQRTKRFAIKPMTTEEAILQMNLLGHQFFMFLNADTEEVNVVYRRNNGNYGLIEPAY